MNNITADTNQAALMPSAFNNRLKELKRLVQGAMSASEGVVSEGPTG